MTTIRPQRGLSRWQFAIAFLCATLVLADAMLFVLFQVGEHHLSWLAPPLVALLLPAAIPAVMIGGPHGGSMPQIWLGAALGLALDASLVALIPFAIARRWPPTARFFWRSTLIVCAAAGLAAAALCLFGVTQLTSAPPWDVDDFRLLAILSGSVLAASIAMGIVAAVKRMAPPAPDCEPRTSPEPRTQDDE